MSKKPIRVLVVGLGNMGIGHAIAYHNHPDCEIVGLVSRSRVDLPEELRIYPYFPEYKKALAKLKPELASINTYSDTHAEYAIAAMELGAHVFLEKPIATNVDDAKLVVACAKKHKRKLVVGYILRHHPSWLKLIDEAKKLGGPYVFRLNINQQSSGPTCHTHKQLMQTTSPIVDCGVHYVDLMCQITDAKPVKVCGMGVRLTEEINAGMHNYEHFQVIFEDGSLGWFEAGWGPMMSETAFFVKYIISPNGGVSIIMDEAAKPDDIDTHTHTSTIRVHKGRLDKNGNFAEVNQDLTMAREPDHQALCDREQAFMVDAIRSEVNLDKHMQEAVQALQICLAADESIRTGKEINL